MDQTMQAHEILLQDPIPDEVMRRVKLPSYQVDSHVAPAYVLSEDGKSVFQVTHQRSLFVPMLEREGRDLSELTMALLEAALMERGGLSYTAPSLRDAVATGSKVIEERDLKLGFVLVRTGAEIDGALGASVIHHESIEPGLVVCLPESEFLGRLPVHGSRFGMMIYNTQAVVPVKVTVH